MLSAADIRPANTWATADANRIVDATAPATAWFSMPTTSETNAGATDGEQSRYRKTMRMRLLRRRRTHFAPLRARKGVVYQCVRCVATFPARSAPRRPRGSSSRCARRKPSRRGCGAYWTSSPARSGPPPRPATLAIVATAEALVCQCGGAASITAAVAVPVKDAGRKPRQQATDQKERHRIGHQEHDGTGEREHDSDEKHRAPADRIGPAAERNQRRQHPCGISREDDRGGQHLEVQAFAVQRVHRRRQRRADHDHSEGVRQQGECVSTLRQGLQH